MQDGSNEENKLRVKSMERKAMEKTRRRRKQLWSIRKGLLMQKLKKKALLINQGHF